MAATYPAPTRTTSQPGLIQQLLELQAEIAELRRYINATQTTLAHIKEKY